jgi:hypothetical protein
MRQAAFCWRFGCCYFSACWLSVPVVKNQNKNRTEKKNLSGLSQREKNQPQNNRQTPPSTPPISCCVSALSRRTRAI